MSGKVLLEIAVDSLERAAAAERGGADRLELCANLEEGGVTPSSELIQKVRSSVEIPIHVMVRPRSGNFVYSDDEFARMKQEIAVLQNLQVQGIVVGVLLSEHTVDVRRTKGLVERAWPLDVTFHRAFDATPDLATALEHVISTGARRILTSGGAADAASGVSALGKLVEQARNRVTILPGGGLHVGNIAAVARSTGAQEIHTALGSMIPYNSPDPSAFESAVRACRQSLRM
jgi:copper homeostasis protein